MAPSSSIEKETTATSSSSSSTLIPANHQRTAKEIRTLVNLRVQERDSFKVNGVEEPATPPLKLTLRFLLTKMPKYALFRPPTRDYLDEHFPILPLEWNKLQSADPAKIQITWLGHASLLVQMNGLNMLMDPVFSDRCSPSQWFGPKRYRKPPCSVAELCSNLSIDLVLLSHNHYDHLDTNTVRDLSRLSPDTPFVVPLGLQPWLRQHVRSDLSIYELDWYETSEIAPMSSPSPPSKGKGIRVTALPMRHWSNRTGDKDQTLWCGYSVQAPGGRSFLFPGDTAWFDGLEDLGRKYGPWDVAAIPIGAYEPRNFMRYNHVNVEEAVRMKEAVRAKFGVPIHWGTFPLTEEPVLEPREKLVHLMGEDKSFAPFLIGETKIF